MQPLTIIGLQCRMQSLPRLYMVALLFWPQSKREIQHLATAGYYKELLNIPVAKTQHDLGRRVDATTSADLLGLLGCSEEETDNKHAKRRQLGAPLEEATGPPLMTRPGLESTIFEDLVADADGDAEEVVVTDTEGPQGVEALELVQENLPSAASTVQVLQEADQAEAHPRSPSASSNESAQKSHRSSSSSSSGNSHSGRKKQQQEKRIVVATWNLPCVIWYHSERYPLSLVIEPDTLWSLGQKILTALTVAQIVLLIRHIPNSKSHSSSSNKLSAPSS